jgi:chromosome segregation ATPase
MNSAVAEQTQHTATARLREVEHAIRKHAERSETLTSELLKLESALEIARKEKGAEDPLRWSPARAKFAELSITVEDKRSEISRYSETRDELEQRRAQLVREIADIDQKVGATERAYDQARDEFERAQGALLVAKRDNSIQGIADWQPIVEKKKSALAEKLKALNEARALRGDPPLSENANRYGGAQPRSKIANLRAASTEFAALDDEVSRLERQHDRERDQIADVESQLKRLDDSFARRGGSIATGVATVDGVAVDNRNPLITQKRNRIATELPTLRDKFAKTCSDLEAKRSQRDAMLAAWNG